LGESLLEKMEIGESFLGKKHGKLAHFRNLAPKIIYGLRKDYQVLCDDWLMVMI
jgi:hypothetical protein